MFSIISLSVKKIITKSRLNIRSRTHFYINYINNWSMHGFIDNLSKDMRTIVLILYNFFKEKIYLVYLIKENLLNSLYKTFIKTVRNIVFKYFVVLNQNIKLMFRFKSLKRRSYNFYLDKKVLELLLLIFFLF